MIPEIGHFALLVALCIAVVQGLVPLAGTTLGVQRWIALARTAALAQFLFLAISYACLTWAFVAHDFSVLYVANNSNSGLPLLYRISGVWGSHEGSLLLWALVLAIWTAAVALFTPSVPRAMRARVLAVLGLVSCGFLLFIILTSNPFERLLPAPSIRRCSISATSASRWLSRSRSPRCCPARWIPRGRAGRGPGPTSPGCS